MSFTVFWSFSRLVPAAELQACDHSAAGPVVFGPEGAAAPGGPRRGRAWCCGPSKRSRLDHYHDSTMQCAALVLGRGSLGMLGVAARVYGDVM
jgi:hypothetical protein